MTGRFPPRAEGDAVPVLFVMGKGRSGSTILDNILGQVPGMTSTGELVRLWEWGLRDGVLCGCGRDVLSCPVWSQVLADAFGIRSRTADADRIDAIRRDYRAVLRWHEAARLFGRRGPGRWRELERLTRTMGALYRTLREVTGASVVVDSSKTPLNPAALGLVDGVAGAVVHLVRDPRAVAFSWQRTKAWTDRQGIMPRHGYLHTSASWTLRNLTAEMIQGRWPAERTTRLRYEDFTAAPRATIARLVELVGLPTDQLPFSDERTALLSTTHTVGGNPNRMSRGAIAVRADDEWVQRLDGRSRRIVSLLTAPLLARYGYTR